MPTIFRNYYKANSYETPDISQLYARMKTQFTILHT